MSASNNILWLLGPSGISDQMKFNLGLMLKRVNIDSSRVYYLSVHSKLKAEREPAIIKKGNKRVFNDKLGQKIRDGLLGYVKSVRPRIIVCNDAASLAVITNGNISLDLCRGSVYYFEDIPVIVVDELYKIYATGHGRWVLSNDLGKISRWYSGKQRSEPRLNLKVCHTLQDLQELESVMCNAIAVAEDIETYGRFITCVSFAGLMQDGRVLTYVVPFLNPTKPGGAHWDTPELEIWAWGVIRAIHESPAIKVMQNGSYDSTYFIRNNVPPILYLVDTCHLFHSIWMEAPKKLNFIASICLDHCVYWKDELKGSQDDKLPRTPENLERYWRYNGLDSHITLLSARYLLALIAHPQMAWALENYRIEFALQVGPCLAGQMRGMRVNTTVRERKRLELLDKGEAALLRVRKMVDDMDFNPNSSDQVCQVLYDILGAPVPKVKRGRGYEEQRTADEKALKNIAALHPLYDIYIKAIGKAKKPFKAISTYIDVELWNGKRFLYSLKAAGTETGRLSSSEHPFWMGTNAQNVPEYLRDMCVADPGYIFFEADYAQSDAWFVAFESEDPAYMHNVSCGKDTHCLHAAHFFKETYEHILTEYKNSNEHYSHPVLGVRAVTKRLVHGSNFRMQGFTLYQTMGRDAVLAAARALGFKDCHLWTDKEIVSFCDALLDSYHVLYPGLRPWYDRSVKEAVAAGGKATASGGRTRLFFSDLTTDKAAQRELTAFFGQGGTAGNINRSMLALYYTEQIEKFGAYFITQTHDSFLFLLPEKSISLIDDILTIMQAPVTIKGRTFKVPAEGKVGYAWGPGLLKYKPGMDVVADCRAHVTKLFAKNYGILSHND